MDSDDSEEAVLGTVDDFDAIWSAFFDPDASVAYECNPIATACKVGNAEVTKVDMLDGTYVLQMTCHTKV